MPSEPHRTRLGALLYRGIELLIVDLDGTARYTPDSPCPNKRGEQRIYPEARVLLQRAIDEGVPIAFATNQGGVAYGFLTEQGAWDLILETSELLDLTEAATAYCCTDHPEEETYHRKPRPGMLLQAIVDAEVDPAKTMYVGDRQSDMTAATRAGCIFMWASNWRALANLRPGEVTA